MKPQNTGLVTLHDDKQKEQDTAMQRLIDLETTKRILKEMEDKGIEL